MTTAQNLSLLILRQLNSGHLVSVLTVRLQCLSKVIAYNTACVCVCVYLHIPVLTDSFILMAQMGGSDRGGSAPTS